ncbi:DUF4381 domain-containing protein [Brucella pituitosa]|uniref:DUF4381 domain-containing protein n=1 Tax=Brucella pituitosa TaxID=571256 RepID=UPI002002DAEB|nr:DUF4381 domain-containing protein [Brucella pituitosa]MCK4206865.1 DUF4381 domain-containing protein [Brucella pituitosa]
MQPPAPVLDPMAETALRSLKDIVVPPPISWIPQTWGWGFLGLALVAGLLSLLLWQLRQYRANAYRREALSMLTEIDKRLRDRNTKPQAIAELASLLKRTALGAWPRTDVADLSGEKWAEFLAAHAQNKTGQTLSKLVNDFEYRSEDDIGNLQSHACDDLISAARNWIEHHHVSA